MKRTLPKPMITMTLWRTPTGPLRWEGWTIAGQIADLRRRARICTEAANAKELTEWAKALDGLLEAPLR